MVSTHLSLGAKTTDGIQPAIVQPMPMPAAIKNMLTGAYHQSDAAMIIRQMVKAGYLEEVMLDTYRRKKQWSRQD
jgi:hypothetical protein